MSNIHWTPELLKAAAEEFGRDAIVGAQVREIIRKATPMAEITHARIAKLLAAGLAAEGLQVCEVHEDRRCVDDH